MAATNPLDRLGRRHAPDQRDDLFLAARQLDLERPRQATTGYRYWFERFNVDQSGPTCFPAGTLVELADGSSQPIEALPLLAEVVTAEGRTGRVLRTQAKFHTDGLIRVRTEGHNHLRMTSEHPVLTTRGYVAAKDLQVGEDYIAFPKYEAETKTVAVPISRGDRGRWQNVQAFGREGRGTVSTKLPTEIQLDKSFGRLLGLYIAEGSARRSGALTWTFGSHESELIEETVGLIGEVFGVEARPYDRGRSGSTNVSVQSSGLAVLFERLVSRGSGGKRLNGEIASGPREFLEAMLYGWIDGDGHRRNGRAQGTTVSKQLAIDMFRVANLLGLQPSIQTGKGKPSGNVKTRRDRWDVHFNDMRVAPGGDNWRRYQDETHMWRRVKALEHEEFAGFVFNLEVEGDQSYVADGMGVHNCVANTAAHILGDSPRTWPLSWLDTLPQRHLTDNTGRLISPVGYKSQTSGQAGFRGLLYDQAQLVDEWADTPPGAGTSFRAAAKVLQRWGFISSYLWLRSVDEIALAVLNHGPVALGCDWLEGLYYDVSDGQLVHATGASVGGHEVVLDGVNMGTRRFRIQTWGIRMRISFSDVALLLGTGDAALVTEVP